MSFFYSLLNSRGMIQHDGRALWKYNISDEEFDALQAHLRKAILNSSNCTDATLYFAEWWKRLYNGGKTSKELVFSSLDRKSDDTLDAVKFYQFAKQGAVKLSINWIRKQNTLFLRTLLLQGGLPIGHITQNAGFYQNFLLKLLDLQPSSVEEVLSNSSIIKLIPESNRNEDLIENCLAIVFSITNESDEYQELFKNNKTLEKVNEALLTRKKELGSKVHVQKATAFWCLDLTQKEQSIFLRIGLSDQYTRESIQKLLNLEVLPTMAYYHVFVDDTQLFTFRKMLSGNYKTFWESTGNIAWHAEEPFHQFYCMTEDSTWNLPGFIKTQPSLEEPSLWSPISEKEFKLVRGNSINDEEGYVLLPNGWKTSGMQVNQDISKIVLHDMEFDFVKFSGQITLERNHEEIQFSTNSQPFEWLISSSIPQLIKNTSIPIITGSFKMYVYHEDGVPASAKAYSIFYRTNKGPNWTLYEPQKTPLPLGLLEIKINYQNKIAYDRIFNIGAFTITYTNQNLREAIVHCDKLNGLQIEIENTVDLDVSITNQQFHLKLCDGKNVLPQTIIAKIKFGAAKAVYINLVSPFKGLGLVGKDGELIKDKSTLMLHDLYGIRILTSNVDDTIVKMWNTTRDDVRIYKNILMSQHPINTFKEHLQRLFYLADSMSHQNRVGVEISAGGNKISFYVKGFSHTIDDINDQRNGRVKINGDGEIEPIAIQLNNGIQGFQEQKLVHDSTDSYQLPLDSPVGQYIIFSDLVNGRQLQPRFITTEPDFIAIDKEVRIDRYKAILLENDFTKECWEELKVCYELCRAYKIPFSTFDQIRATSIHPLLAAKAFFFFALNQSDKDDFIQLQVPALEQDLGFCFHWINNASWQKALETTTNWIGHQFIGLLFEYMKLYFQEIGLEKLYPFIIQGDLDKVLQVSNQTIIEERGNLGEKVLSELPKSIPHITERYGINFGNHEIVKLLICSPIAVAESILDKSEMTIWGNEKFVSRIRRNIQYAKYISPTLYSKVLFHTLAYTKNN